MLNPHFNIEVIKAQTELGLRLKLRALKTPYGIINMYSDGKFHYAWISPDRRISDRTKAYLDSLEKEPVNESN